MKSIFKKIGLCAVALTIIGGIGLSLSSCKNKSNTTNGLSAYEIAVKNGFNGTEQEWLESLKGIDGKDGVDGKDNSITLESMYNECKANGYDGSFLEFVKLYAQTTTQENLVMNHTLLNAVAIKTTWTETYNSINMWTGQVTTQTQETSAKGSGVFYEINKSLGDAYIITNYHVVYDSNQKENNGISTNIKAYLYGYESDKYAVDCLCVGGSYNYDLALLKVTNNELIKKSEAVACNYSNEDIYLGQKCYAVGNNNGEGLSINSGIVSLKSFNASYQIGKGVCTVRTFRYDAATNGGNSGGGVYNEFGQLIGIVNCKAAATYDNLCYAIPLNIVSGLIDLIKYEFENSMTSLERYLLGVSVSDIASELVYNTTNGTYNVKNIVEVTEVSENGASKNIIQVGDIIKSITINDKSIEVTNSYDVIEFMFNARLNDVASVVVNRNNTDITLNITLSVGTAF